MGDATASLPTLSNLHTITDRQTHDTAVAKAQGTPPSYTDGVPTLIYVSSSSNPSCQTALPKVLDLAKNNAHVQVYVLELTPETTPMIKFGHQNTPIFIMMKGARWCETVLGPDFRRVQMIFQTTFKEEGGEGEKGS